MSGLARAGTDLHDAIGDLRHLQLEQALDQARVGTADHDLRALRRLAYLHDVGLQPGVRLRPLERHLLGLGKQRLDAPQVQEGVPGIGLLDHAGDDVALPAGVLLVLEVPLGLADPLGHDLTGRLGGDPAEVVRRDVELLTDGLALLVEVLGQHPDVHRVRVDGHPRELVGTGRALVGRLQRVGEGGEQHVHGDSPVDRQGLEGLHHLKIHDPTFLPGASASPRSFPLRSDLGSGVHTKTVCAFKISS